MMEEELKEIKAELRSLVLSSPAALNVQALLKDYRGLMGHSLPITRFGYRDPISFLKEKCDDCFLGPSRNPILTAIVPDRLKHIDKYVQKQKTVMKGKIKRTSVLESTIYPPRKNLVSSTFSNKNSTNNKKQSPILSKKLEVTNIEQPKPVANSRIKKFVPTIAINDKGNNENSSIKPRRDSGSYSEDNHSVPNFLKKRMPLLESLQNLDLEDEKEIDISVENKYERENSDSGRQTSSSSSSTKQLKMEILKKEIFEIVDEHPEGVLCADLVTLYRERHGKELEFGRLGHMSLVSAGVALGLRATRVAGDYRLGRHTPPPEPAPRPAAPRAPRASPPQQNDDDALPGVEYDADVFPADCLQYLSSIPALQLGGLDGPGGLARAGRTLDVLPAEVYSPAHLWLVLLGPAHHAALDDLMDDMNVYYKRGEGASRSLAPGAVRVGHYCACLYAGDWHRAIIVRVLDCSTVKVRHVDYGTVQTVSARALRPLLRRYGSLPVQAVRARLAGLRPALRARRYPPSAALRLLELLRDTPHVAAVQHVQDNILEVYLINTTGAEDVCVNDELIREGYAEPAPVPATGVHLAPTFGALEAGATPSLADCLTYLRDGIQLDFVADYRAHVPPLLPPAPPTPPTPEPAEPTPSPPLSPRPAMLYPPRNSLQPLSCPSPLNLPPTAAAHPPNFSPAASPLQYPGSPPTFVTGAQYATTPAGLVPGPAAFTPRLAREAATAGATVGAGWGEWAVVRPPPGFGWAPRGRVPSSPWAGGGLSAAESEMLQLVARVQPALARRFVAERLCTPQPPQPPPPQPPQPPQPPPGHSLNPLAPEFQHQRF